MEKVEGEKSSGHHAFRQARQYTCVNLDNLMKSVVRNNCENLEQERGSSHKAHLSEEKLILIFVLPR